MWTWFRDGKLRGQDMGEPFFICVLSVHRHNQALIKNQEGLDSLLPESAMITTSSYHLTMKTQELLNEDDLNTRMLGHCHIERVEDRQWIV